MTAESRYLVGLDLGQRQDPTALSVVKKRMIELDTQAEPPTASGVVVKPPGTDLGIVHGHAPAAQRKLPKTLSRYDCSLLQRFEVHTPYPNIVERVCGLFCQPELEGASLVVDWTGVGTGIVDYFVKAKTEPVKCPKCKGVGAHNATRPPYMVGDKPVMLGGGEACLTCGGRGKIKLKANVRPVYITAGSKWTADGPGWRVSKQDLVAIAQILIQQVLPDGLPRLVIDPRLRYAAATVDEFKSFRYKVTEAANLTYEQWREGSHGDLVMSLACALWVGEVQSKKFWCRL